MISLNKISVENKSTVLFGLTALFLSFVTGFLAGIRWNIVILRSVVLMVLFAAIGFGVCVILRKFVPEVYGFLASMPPAGSEEAADREPDIDMPAGMEAAAADEGEKPGGAPLPDAMGGTRTDEFKELDKEGLSHYSTAAGGGSGVHTPSGKLGKHILEKEKLAKYEPKIMAQAVRTMMGRERE